MSFFLKLLAEREGFEPSVGFKTYDSLAVSSFRPLRHLSVTRVIILEKEYLCYVLIPVCMVREDSYNVYLICTTVDVVYNSVGVNDDSS